MESFRIDHEAKPPIQLLKVRDASGNPYYIGKLQWPGTLEFERGASFMVFVSEEGYEELQIAPLDPSRRFKSRNGATMSGGRLSINLNPMVDRNNRTYYVGEVVGLPQLDLFRGIFFTIFLSKPGQEEIQITRLNHKQRKQRKEYPEFETQYRRVPQLETT